MTQSSSGATAWDQDRTIIRFPDPAIEVVDERFGALVVGAEIVERLWTGGRWLEGPVWFGDGRYLLFSDIPNNRILRWTEETGEVTEFRKPSNNSNGNTRDRQGRLVTCEHLTRRVTRTEHDGTITVLHGRLRRQAAERAQRRRRALRRLDLVHRSGLGDRGQLRRRQGREAARAVRLPDRSRQRRGRGR